MRHRNKSQQMALIGFFPHPLVILLVFLFGSRSSRKAASSDRPSFSLVHFCYSAWQQSHRVLVLRIQAMARGCETTWRKVLEAICPGSSNKPGVCGAARH